MKKNIKITGLFGLIAVLLVGGVFAYWTQELTVHNEFQTARYDTKLDEKFVSPSDWLPGQDINKDVWVTNEGSIPVFAKIVIHQEWVRRENVLDVDGNPIEPLAGEEFPLAFGEKNDQKYAAVIHWGKDVRLLESGRTGKIDLGLETVSSIDKAAGKWLLVSDEPDSDKDFTLYYMGVVDVDEKTPFVVDGVEMNPAIEPTILEKRTTYDKSQKKWFTKIKYNGNYDYESARYTMTVTASTVQATADAVKEVFGSEKDQSDVVDWLSSNAVDPLDMLTARK